MPVKDKVVIVTGGAQGIGRHIARTFGQAGAHVAVADIASFDNVVKDFDQIGAEVMPVKTDLRDEDQVKSLMRQVWWKHGHIDVLINNAGIVTHFNWGVPRWPLIENMEKSFYDNVMSTNVGGTFLTTKHVIPYMKNQRSGHIINVGQGNLIGKDRPPFNRPDDDRTGATVYSVSKIAIRAFTQGVADEVRDFGICVISVGPGGGPPGSPPGIAGEEAPPWARARMNSPEVVGDRYVLAAEAPMDLSGYQVNVTDDGELVLAP